MPTSSRRRRTPLLALVATLAVALVAGTGGTSAVAGPAPVVPASAPAVERPGPAQQALARAQAVLGGVTPGVGPSVDGHGRRTTGGPSGRGGDATLALRDLALLRPQLTGADRRSADALLARPTQARPTQGRRDPIGNGYSVAEEPPVCSAKVCVHYVATTADAPLPLDVSPANGVPDYVDLALATLTSVHERYVAAGYRAPKGDGTRGGNARTDVYLADIGDKGLYGYCTTDDKTAFRAPWSRSAYCVLDEDYSPTEFGTNTPTENLQVTAAHEYFHAVQYAYDFKEDGWLLEATAAWVEDEMYDAVDDNLQYLRFSPLTRPRTPLDTSEGGFFYGTWIFFRYLSERFSAKAGGLPTVVRDIWRRADGNAGAPDQYSWQAVSSVLRARGTTAPQAFAAFADANRRPARTYAEGEANRYPKPRLVQSLTLGTRGTAQQLRLSHLTAGTYRLSPGSALKAPRWRVRLNLDLPPVFRGSAAVATVHLKDGAVRRSVLKVRPGGTLTTSLSFSRATVDFVDLTLVNASGRYRCFQRADFSCQGESRDDRLVHRFTARPFR